MSRRPLAARLTLVSALVLTLAASVPGVVAAEGPIVPTTTTKVLPYVPGQTLTWSAFDQLSATGPGDPDGATRLAGVAGGSGRIVVTGTDVVANQAASWRSSDGGVSWTEHLVPAARSFGQLAAHGGVYVTHDGAFWSSTNGASWTRAVTGPHAMYQVEVTAGPQGFVAFVRNGTSTITRVWYSRTGTSNSWIPAPLQSVVSSFCPTSIAATSTRIVAIGHDCAARSRPRVLVSSTGRLWSRASVPAGLRTAGEFVREPSISYVSGRYLVTGSNATQTATWVWSSTDGRSWRHVSSMPRAASWTTDTIVKIFRLGEGWLAIGHRDMPADDAVLVAWRSTDLRRWTRFSPPVAGCPATVHMVSQAAVTGGRMVAVGTPWSIGSSCGQTWMAKPTP